MSESVADLIIENRGQKETFTGRVDTGAPGALVVDTSVAQRLNLPDLGVYLKPWGWGAGSWNYHPTIIDQISMPGSGCVLKNVYAEYGPFKEIYKSDFLLGEGFLRAFPELAFTINPDGSVSMECGAYTSPLLSPWTLGGAAVGFVGASVALAALLKK